jgi:hypothetical protein
MEEEQPSQSQLVWLAGCELKCAYAADADHPLRSGVGVMAGI